jgi:SAM-dependent methyltransferase
MYNRKPIRFHGEIPVFSDSDEYCERYERISKPRLAYLDDHGDLEPERQESENSTVILMKKYLKAGDRVLDVGIGLARQLSHFPYCERYGLDISFGYLERARKMGICVCFSRIEEMPYQDAFFDAVVCTDVLEHLIDLHRGIQKILAVLKPGGLAFIRTPNEEDLSPYLSPDFPYKFSHLRTFDEASLRLLFEKLYGCKTLETSYAVYLPLPSRFLVQVAIPGRDKIMGRIMSVLQKRKSSWYDRALKRLYKPIEINIVVQKGMEDGLGYERSSE